MCSKESCWVTCLFFELPLHLTQWTLTAPPVLLIVLERTMLQKSILLLSKSHIASVGDAVLHQVVALRSLWKSLPYLVAGSASGLETKPFWVSESWQMFQAPALLLAECWAVLWFGCCTVSFRLWNPGSVEMILLQFRGMLLLTPAICQFWLCRYKARVPTWHSVSTENPPAMCVVYKQNASFQVWRKNNILRKKVPRLPGEREKTVILFLASIKRLGDKGRGKLLW